MTAEQQVLFAKQAIQIANMLIVWEQRAKALRAFLDAAGGSDVIQEANLASDSELTHLTKAELQNVLFSFETIVATLAAGHLNNLLLSQKTPPV